MGKVYDEAIKTSANAEYPEIKENSKQIETILASIESNTPVFTSAEKIEFGPNVRKKIDTTSLEFMQLMESIEEYGLLQNLVVEFHQINHEKYKFILISGFRRLTALKMLDYDKPIPVLPVLPTFGTRGQALSENLHRSALHFIEEADTFYELKHKEGRSEDYIAKLFERSEGSVNEYLKVAELLPQDAKDLILENKNIFNATYIITTFVRGKKKSAGVIMSMLRRKIKSIHEKNPSNDSDAKKERTTKTKSNRQTKLQTYCKDLGYTPGTSEKIAQAFRDFGFI